MMSTGRAEWKETVNTWIPLPYFSYFDIICMANVLNFCSSLAKCISGSFSCDFSFCSYIK